MTPRVSVICIFYNAEAYFAEAIDSVLAQDFKEFELLLADDGSTDASTELARKYARQDPERIRYLEHPGHENRGMSAARNLGLKHARGEFIAFIDSDDRWRPNKLREQVALLDRMPGVDALCGAVNFWASSNGGVDRTVPTGHVQNCPVEPPDALLHLYPLGSADPPCPSDIIMRRAVVDAVGGFEESFKGRYSAYEDQAFLTKLYLVGTCYFADRVWLDYRLHDASCIAELNRSGGYAEVRGQFLNWYDGYLARSPYRNHRPLRRAMKRALFPYRHRRLWQARIALGKLARKALPR